MASSKLTQPVIFSSHQLCGFLCHLPEPASYPLWLCVFGDIWHLKERGKSEHGKNTQQRAPHWLASPNSPDKQWSSCTDTRRTMGGFTGFPRKLLAASQLSFPTRRAVSHCLAFCRHVIRPHMSHSWEADASPIRIKLATPTCSQTSLARQLDQL